MTAATTTVVMIAFAANSLLCRGALATDEIDPYTFTLLRVGSGALVLWFVVKWRSATVPAGPHGSWRSGAALLGYALAFSLAYLTLDAGTGALILFAGVQVTMIVGGVLAGERPPPRKWLGLVLAFGGLVYLVSPGVTAPDPLGAAAMGFSGFCWGIYSLHGRGASAPLVATARNFGYAVPLALLATLAGWGAYHANEAGVALALTSGAVTSGLGYALWYRALAGLTATTAAVVQLSVPVIAALGGVLLLNETLTIRLASAGLIILAGIALAVTARSS